MNVPSPKQINHLSDWEVCKKMRLITTDISWEPSHRGMFTIINVQKIDLPPLRIYFNLHGYRSCPTQFHRPFWTLSTYRSQIQFGGLYRQDISCATKTPEDRVYASTRFQGHMEYYSTECVRLAVIRNEEARYANTTGSHLVNYAKKVIKNVKCYCHLERQ